MKRLLLFGVLAAAVLVPVAAASPAATHTLRGTVVAKDRAHHALVVALPGGKVQMLVAPAAFGRTDIGRRVVIRYTGLAGQLPVALGVSLKGHARHVVVRGTIVRLVKRHAILNAGGSVLNVTLKAPKGQRVLASAKDAPKAGDTVKVEVDIDDDDSLDVSAIVVTGAPTGPAVGSGGEMEVRGAVASLTPSGTSSGSIIVTVMGVPVPCAIPVGVTLSVVVGAPIELTCDLIGNPGVWTVRVAHGEDEDSDSGDDDSSKVEVRGIITVLNATTVTVTPAQGAAVPCMIPVGILLAPRFALNDVVKMECVMVATTPTLKEIEKNGVNSDEQSDDDDDDESSDD